MQNHLATRAKVQERTLQKEASHEQKALAHSAVCGNASEAVFSEDHQNCSFASYGGHYMAHWHWAS
jgi:hypothetical protein